MTTITYKIIDNDFRYHIKKGKVLAKTTISKKEHPCKEVNDFRKSLIDSRKLIDNGKNYLLKEDIKTGMLMAYNLHCGELKKQLENEKKITINSNGDKEIFGIFELKNIYSTDNQVRNRLSKNEIKLLGVYKYKINENFFLGNNPDEFSESEKLVARVLKNNNIIAEYRHGISEKNEADIVEENAKKQIEVIFEYKNKIKDKKRAKMDKGPLLISELVDTNLIQTSAALEKKLYQKEYTSEYEIELAILCIGNRSSILTMMSKLKQLIENKGIPKNDFKSIYILGCDLFNNTLIFFDGKSIHRFQGEEYDIEIIDKKRITYEEIKDEKEYYFETINIFTKDQGVSIMDGKTAKHFFKDIAIYY